ncbi:hypothetical protein ACH4UX_17905 [Streptomyces althioticus]
MNSVAVPTTPSRYSKLDAAIAVSACWTASLPTSPAPDATSPITDRMYAAAPMCSTSASITTASSAVTAFARPIGERSTGNGFMGTDE